MRDVAVQNNQVAGQTLPRGWIIVGLALACWAALFGVVALASNVFSFLMSL